MIVSQTQLNEVSLQLLGMKEFPSDVEKGSLDIIKAYSRTGKTTDPMVIAAKNTALLHLRFLAGSRKMRCNVPIFETSCKSCKGSGIFRYQFENKQETCISCKGTGEKNGTRCFSCNGVGNRLVPVSNIESYTPCHSCKGTGFTPSANSTMMNNVIAEGLKDFLK